MSSKIAAVWLVVLALGASLSLRAQAPAPSNPPPTPSRAVQIRGGYLGIGIQEITAERAKVLKLHEEAGVEITRVGPDSPAEKAGLKVGDVVLQYNGMRVEGIEQFSRLVRETPPGREVKIDVFRNGSVQTITARIGQHPPVRGPFPEGFGWSLPDIPRVFPGLRSPVLGVDAEAIDGQLAQFFGVKEGVLVRSVGKDSPAEKAGIKAGDVITKVDDASVGTPSEISARLRPLAGKAVAVIIVREKKETTVTVQLEGPPAR
jgi:serine protease Do